MKIKISLELYDNEDSVRTDHFELTEEHWHPNFLSYISSLNNPSAFLVASLLKNYEKNDNQLSLSILNLEASLLELHQKNILIPLTISQIYGYAWGTLPSRTRIELGKYVASNLDSLSLTYHGLVGGAKSYLIR